MKILFILFSLISFNVFGSGDLTHQPAAIVSATSASTGLTYTCPAKKWCVVNIGMRLAYYSGVKTVAATPPISTSGSCDFKIIMKSSSVLLFAMFSSSPTVSATDSSIVRSTISYSIDGTVINKCYALLSTPASAGAVGSFAVDTDSSYYSMEYWN